MTNDAAPEPSEYCEAKHPDPELDVPGCVEYRGHEGDHQGYLMPAFTRVWWPKAEIREYK